MRQTALIVEDDPVTRHILTTTLATAGIDSIIAETGAAMWSSLEKKPDVIVLDLSLPDADGMELLRQLRQKSEIPVIIHSNRSDEIERIIGIEIGADDYLPKPCNMRELLARVRALLRRSAPKTVSPTTSGKARRLRFGQWTLDTASRELIDSESKPAAIGVSGYALLLAFVEHPFVRQLALGTLPEAAFRMESLDLVATVAKQWNLAASPVPWRAEGVAGLLTKVIVGTT